MDINRNNTEQMYDILTVFGSTVVKEVLDMIRCCDIMVIRDTLVDMNMNNHVECIDALLNIK